MRVIGVIPNLPVADTATANRFYAEALGFDIAGDFGWVGFLTASPAAPVELHTVTRDQTAPVDSVISVRVDDVDAAFAGVVSAGGRIVHPITDEEWAVRRFFFADPDGNVINVVGHR